MHLVEKESAKVTIDNLKVAMSWTSEVDFDLMALSKTKSKGDVLTYFGNKGDLSESPYVKVGADAGVGDTGGENSEDLEIGKIDDDVEQILIICIDYNKAKSGQVARFSESDLKLTVTSQEDTFVVTPEIDKTANACCLARIVNSPDGAELFHDGRMGTLAQFSKSDDVVAAIPYV